jgi:hypothetical protein
MPTLPVKFEHKPITDYDMPEVFKLSKTTLSQLQSDGGRWGRWRWISLKDLKANMPTDGARVRQTEDDILKSTNGDDATWITYRAKSGKLSIGCIDFTPEESRMILRAAGVRVASAKKKSKKKAKSKSNKR